MTKRIEGHFHNPIEELGAQVSLFVFMFTHMKPVSCPCAVDGVGRKKETKNCSQANLREASIHPIISCLKCSEKINDLHTHFLAQLYTGF